MQKKRVIKSLENLSPELKAMLRKRYPDGFDSHLMRIMNAKNEPIFVVPMETEDTMYLVKVAVSRNSEGEYEYDDSEEKDDYDSSEVGHDADEPSEGPGFDDD
jgi:hypothetical protein